MSHVDRRSFLIGGSAATAFASLVHNVFADEPKPAAKPRRVKVGQIGVGHAHASKLAVYRASPDYEVVGIVEPNAELKTAAESQAAYRDLPWMTQEQLLNVPGLEVVLVETHVRHLLDTAEAAVSAGKHVHLDKPAGESLSQYKHILDLASRKNLMVQMGYMFRYNPAVVLLRDLLARGWLGDPFEVHTVMSKVVPPGDRKRLAKYQGGIMFELGCHVIDLVVAMLGAPTKIKAYAQQVSDQSDSLLDNMLAVFEYPRALASVKSSAVEVDGGERRHFVLCGTEGTFHIQPLDNPSARLALSQPREKYRKGYQEITFPKFTRYVGDAADMARVVRGEKMFDFSYAHDLAVQEAVLLASKLPTT